MTETQQISLAHSRIKYSRGDEQFVFRQRMKITSLILWVLFVVLFCGGGAVAVNCVIVFKRPITGEFIIVQYVLFSFIEWLLYILIVYKLAQTMVAFWHEHKLRSGLYDRLDGTLILRFNNFTCTVIRRTDIARVVMVKDSSRCQITLLVAQNGNVNTEVLRTSYFTKRQMATAKQLSRLGEALAGSLGVELFSDVGD